MITDTRCESVNIMESSDAVEDTFEATIVTATVIFVVVVVILTVLVVICMLCRSVPEQVDEGGGRKQTKNLMERAQDLYAYIVHEYFNVTDSDAPMWDSDKQNIRSPLEQSFRHMNTWEEAQIAAEDSVSYY